jgi:tetratricopeptide (TPR) repeat protein
MLVPVVLALALSGAAPSPRAEAVAAYDAGDYASACRILSEMDVAGTLDGPLLYRLFFCRTAAGETAGGREALTRAASALEAENLPGCAVEVPFYLANAYANLGRPEDARRVASETLLRLETEGYEPKSAMEWFQVGKLAQDAGRNDRAEAAYRRAVSGFAAGPPAPGHERWARRFLGNAASARADFEAARPEWRRVVELGNADRSDLLALATACARTERWDEAAEAWRLAEKIDMQNGSDPRYAAALARQAAALGGIPAADAAGVPWARYERDGLESAMREAAAAARDLRAEAVRRKEAGTWNAAARDEAASRLREIRRRFVAAGIEYGVRKLPLRETAFSGNYATLVFQEAEWELPDAP